MGVHVGRALPSTRRCIVIGKHKFRRAPRRSHDQHGDHDNNHTTYNTVSRNIVRGLGLGLDRTRGPVNAAFVEKIEMFAPKDVHQCTHQHYLYLVSVHKIVLEQFEGGEKGDPLPNTSEQSDMRSEHNHPSTV